MIGVIATATALMANTSRSQGQKTINHVAWVAAALTHMLTIKPSMTRADLCRVFRTEGGLSTGLNRRFVYDECPYFKVDVEFEAVGRPGHDESGRVTVVEDSRDVVTKISAPFLEFGICD